MRLADQIVAATKKPDWLSKYFVPFANEVRRAVPFEISDDVGRIAIAIKQSDARKLLTIHEHCRLPFGTTWIEWVGASTEFGETHEEDCPFNPERPRPDRCGALFESLSDENNVARITLAWCHKTCGVNVSPLSVLIDWSGRGLPPGTLLRRSSPEELRHWFAQYKRDSDADLSALDQRTSVIPNPHMMGLWMAVMRNLPADAQRDFYDRALADIKGEGGFCDGLIAAINSRNLVSTSDPADMTRINKARRKMGRPPLLSFRTVRLSLSRTVERRRSEGQGSPLPLHMVRGHFKVRKSGIYWWAPFWRGDAAAGVVSRKGYEVVA